MKLMGLSQIMRRAFAGDDLVALTAELAARVERDARDSAAMLDLANVWQIADNLNLDYNCSGKRYSGNNTTRSRTTPYIPR